MATAKVLTAHAMQAPAAEPPTLVIYPSAIEVAADAQYIAPIDLHAPLLLPSLAGALPTLSLIHI